MNYDVIWTTQFKKDYRLALKRHLDIELLDDIIRALSRGETLPEKNKDHVLSGNWIGYKGGNGIMSANVETIFYT